MSGGSGVYKDLGFRDEGLHYIPNLDRLVVEEPMLTSVSDGTLLSLQAVQRAYILTYSEYLLIIL